MNLPCLYRLTFKPKSVLRKFLDGVAFFRAPSSSLVVFEHDRLLIKNTRYLIKPNGILPTASACKYHELLFNVQHRHNSGSKSGIQKTKEKLLETKEKLLETKEKLLETKEKLQETKSIVEKRIGDMKENILTIPNGLCLARISVTPVLGYLVVQEMYVPALWLCIFAGMTDLLDGYIARNFENQRSTFGSFLDPAADKFLVATLFLTLTFTGLIPVPLTALIITRDLCLATAGLYIRYVSLPPPRTFLRYFDASLSTAIVSPTAISKVNTALQLSLVSISLAAPVFDYVNHPSLQALWYLTAGTTILSGLSYIFTKNTYKILSRVKSKSK